MLQGASNLWFPVLISALSVPQASDDLGRLVEDNWAVLDKVSSIDVLKAFRLIGQLKDFGKYTDDQVWEAIQKKIEGTSEEVEDPDDLKSPEWKVFSNPTKAQESRTFKLRTVEPPTDFTPYFEKIVLVEKLREVRALVGFTRIMSPRDFDNAAKSRITLVSFAVYRIPNIGKALVRAAKRGVRLTVIVETPDRLEGAGEYSTIEALGQEVAACSTVYFWPKENRPVGDNNKVGILHVKCVVADGDWLFLSSANLTQQAFTINMELGILVRGGTMPSRVEQQFDRLIQSGQWKAV